MKFLAQILGAFIGVLLYQLGAAAHTGDIGNIRVALVGLAVAVPVLGIVIWREVTR